MTPPEARSPQNALAGKKLAHVACPETDSPEGAVWGRETLPRALRKCASRWGEKPLLVFPERRLTAAGLLREVEQFALGLRALGAGPREHAAVCLPNLAETCVAELATAALGGAVMFINTRYRISEFEYVLKQSDAATLVLPREFLQIDFLKMLRQVCPEVAQAKDGRVRSAAFPMLQRVIVVGGAPEGLLSYEEVLRRGAASGAAEDLRRQEEAVRPDDMVILQYTSGTTAFPKAVMLSHGQVLRNAFQMEERANVREEDRVLSAMPMFHVGGSVCALLGAVTRGFTLYTSATFDAGAVLRMVAEEIGIRHLCPLYGLSEGSPNVAIAGWSDAQEKRVNTMGRPEPGVEIKIIGGDTGRTLARGERGEICFRGWNVMKGYYQKPEETAAAIDQEGWLHSGDAGYIDDDGFVIWTGRLKDMLRVGGENVSALEVENFLCGHPAIRAAAVVGVPDERLREVLLAFVQLKSGAALTEKELIEYCKERIAGFKVPRHVRFVEQFAMTGSGKIQKYAMREKILREFENAGQP
ncbi:MAG: AMP-binding protein [Acidobacteriia bacterium]|nr:AMP-binding protein [Terriglobia bacterium]